MSFWLPRVVLIHRGSQIVRGESAFCMIPFFWQLEINRLETKLAKLQGQKEEIVANILIEDEHIKTVEEEMQEEREQLKSERSSFQERQDKLKLQQVRQCTTV